MSLRLDPRHLGTLRALASEAGLRPGELVTLWVTERLDAERRGAPSPIDVGPVLESLNDRIEALTRRVDGLASREAAPATSGATSATAAAADSVMPEPSPPRRRGRPPKSESTPAATRKVKRARGKNPAVPLHEEIAAVLAERGPLSAGELAEAVTARGIYAPPRSGKPLDATAVSVRVSNPRYRSRFTRGEGKIGLAG
ncbi:MAG TPA: hypothetical protein VGA91_01930 [Candidatus Limnocylindria bacterium]